MSESDSFIQEVTEEVRRDRLFGLMRKYGWIAILVVVLIVGAAAFNEWRKATERRTAEALGDAVLAAIDDPDAAARADALAAVTPQSADAAVFLDLFQSAARAEAQDKPAALRLLGEIIANPDAPPTYRDLARLKTVILQGSDQTTAERLGALEPLSVPGNAFRVVAMEQIALVHAEFGNNEAAIEVLLTILDEPGATQGLLRRAQQLIVALGGTLPGTENAAGDNG